MGTRQNGGVIVAVIAALVFFGGLISPPELIDDIDAVQAQISCYLK